MNKSRRNNEVLQNPGQLLTHYSPRTPAYIVRTNQENVFRHHKYKKIGVLDINHRLFKLKKYSKCYINLSTKNKNKVTKSLYKSIRLLDDSDVDLILFPDLKDFRDHLSLLIYDKLFRAASGNYLSKPVL